MRIESIPNVNLEKLENGYVLRFMGVEGFSANTAKELSRMCHDFAEKVDKTLNTLEKQS